MSLHALPQGAKARKTATREEKLASTLEGREGREKFGKRRKAKGGGSTNKVARPKCNVVQGKLTIERSWAAAG